MEYEIGEEVRVVNEIPPDGDNGDGDLEHLLGQIVIIVDIDLGGGEYLVQDEDGEEWWANEDWIEGPYSRDKGTIEESIKILSELDKEDMYVSLQKVENIAKEIFGEERVWGKMIAGTRRPKYEIYIHFPEITLTNSQGASHTIYDLYTRFQVSINLGNFDGDNYKCNIEFTGRRNTSTIKEMVCNYGHSHLEGNVESYSYFCLGNSVFAELLENLKMSMSPTDWELMFLSLDNYLKWESLEGGPYYKMRDLSYRTEVSMESVEEDLYKIVGRMPKDIWDLSEDGMKLIEGTSFRRFLDGNMTIKNMDGHISADRFQGTIKIWENGTPKLQWKDSVIPFKIKNELEGAIKNENSIIDDSVLKICSKILNNKAKDFIKKLEYDNRKNNHRKKVFGEI